MRLLSLDFDPVYGTETTRAAFSSDTSVFDYDVVIWDPANSFHDYTGFSNHYRNRPSLSESRSVQIRGDARRRLTEFTDFVNSGRVLVVVVCPPQLCYVDTGERTYSGTGRNRQTTTHVAEFDLLSALPVPKETVFSAASGTRIDLDGDGPLVGLMRKYADRLRYEGVMKNAPGTLLAHVAGTNRQVASIQRSKDGGYFILLPRVDLERALNDEADESDDGGWVEDAPQYQADLLAAIDQLAGAKVSSRPDWAAQYVTHKQRDLRDSIVQQQSRIETARARLAKLQHEQEAAEARDQLFLGSGRALELEVKRVLELLGGNVTEPAPGRDDWRVAFPEGDAVVEVKGVGKSAAEKHAAQLEKWVAAAFEETGSMPKAILIVNTWRDIPLGERTGKDFPDQMVPYCKSRNHCLVTGLQLFVIQEEIEADPSRAAFWRERLMKTSGVLRGATGWQQHIRTDQTAEAR